MLNTKNSQIVAAVIILLLGVIVGKMFAGSRTIERIIENGTSLAGVTNFDDLAVGPRIQDYQGGELVAGDNEDAWQNDTGRTVFADLGTITTSGTASSSYRFYMFATSSSAVPAGNYWTALTEASSRLGNSLIGGIVAPTSTTATTTNSITAAAISKGTGVITIPSGWYLITYYQAVDTAACGATVCEPATSTNNGLGKVTWTAHTFATSSNKQ